jgi:hypothetical protein
MKQSVELVEILFLFCTITTEKNLFLGSSVCTQSYALACKATTERNYTTVWSYSEICLAGAPTYRGIK